EQGPLLMGERPAPPDRSVPLAQSFREVLHAEEDTTYFGSMHATEATDRWLWGAALHAPSSRDYDFQLPNLATDAGEATLRLRLYGYSDDHAVDPDHRVVVAVNGRDLATLRFDGMGMHVAEAPMPEGRLQRGVNTLTIENAGRTGATVDAVAVDWFEIEHDAGYASDGAGLEFGAPSAGRHSFTVSGFRAPGIEVWDISQPDAPVVLTHTLVEPPGDGTYRVRLTDDGGGAGPDPARYVAFVPDLASQPSRIEPDVPSDLRSPDNGADYVVISHADFIDALQPLVDRRGAQGLRVLVADIQDVYDEFSDGVFDPHAIRAFLLHAREHWQPPAPTYVLLVGEANLDYKGAYGRGSEVFVPSIQVDVDVSGELAAVTSDLWYANLDSDERDVVPDVLLGRLPVSTAAQASTIVSKTLAFEDSPPGEGWQRGAAMVVDDDAGGSFESLSEELIAHMPVDTAVTRFYARTYPRDRDISADISAAVTDGVLLLNYVGHGNVDLWGPWPGGGRIYQNSDIARLANGAKLPLFTTATCMNGWIDHPLKPVSMAELWLTHPGGGGVAAWSPTGFTSLARNRFLLDRFYAGLYDGRGLTLGALTAEALALAHSHSPESDDTIRQFVLLGDPALVVSGVPVNPSPTPSVTPDGTATPPGTPSATATPTAPVTATPAAPPLYLPLATN
ncbi:MAG: C25 family cysteine peptidase, partial [Anaerolineae bacterium]